MTDERVGGSGGPLPHPTPRPAPTPPPRIKLTDAQIAALTAKLKASHFSDAQITQMINALHAMGS